MLKYINSCVSILELCKRPSVFISNQLFHHSARHISSASKRRAPLKTGHLLSTPDAESGSNKSDSDSDTNCSDSKTTDMYDIVIAGGGMVGGSMAAALANEPLLQQKKILLLEGAPQTKYKGPPLVYSSRTCALSPATKTLFESFGAWSHIEKLRLQEVKRMQVWDSCSDSMITFGDDMETNLAYIVENDIIQHAIMTQVESMCDRVSVQYNSAIEGYELPVSTGSEGFDSVIPYVTIRLGSGHQLQAKLLIGADGYNSLVRRSADIETTGWDYNQIGIVGTLKLSEPTTNTTAWQRFLATGPLALLPVSSQHACLIWSTTREQAKHLLALSDENFIDAVNQALYQTDDKNASASYALDLMNNVLESVGVASDSVRQYPPTYVSLEEGTRAAFPLVLRHASQYVRTRMALIGDAAHRLHPLAGQGVNLGFGDVACLTQQVAQAVYNGSDVGSLSHLLRYETERQKAVVPVMATVDGLYRLYTTDCPPLVMLRTLGLNATNLIAPIKDQIKRFAAS